MKTLAPLFFFLSSYAVGQTLEIGTSAPRIIHWGYHVLTIEDMADYWQEYSDSCRNDVTKHDRLDEGWLPEWAFFSDSSESMFRTPGEVYRSDERGWVHRPRYYTTHRKPDFPGFMAFLKRRIPQ